MTEPDVKTKKLKAPFPFFGGKQRIAHVVWDLLGDPSLYIEPFFGSGVVLLRRPSVPKQERVNDINGFLTNFYRAVQRDPDAVADLMNWPVNEIDIEARHRWLCRMPDKEEFLHRMKHDPDYYDVKRAAYWCWGLCAWIGKGWCEGSYFPDDDSKSRGRGVVRDASKVPELVSKGIHKRKGKTVKAQLPKISGAQGVHKKRHVQTQVPNMMAFQKVHRKIPNNAVRGVNSRLPQISSPQGINAVMGGSNEYARQFLRNWMRKISDRMREVRVCCGDWKRVLTKGALSGGGTSIGIFLDPPYKIELDGKKRRDTVYTNDSDHISDEVRKWCIEHENDSNIRMVVAGYDLEHKELTDRGWGVVAWKAQGGMANFGDGKITRNRFRERLWYWPNTLGSLPRLLGNEFVPVEA